MKQKFYQLTETGKAEILSVNCPICGAGVDGDTSTWDFVSKSQSPKSGQLHSNMGGTYINRTSDCAFVSIP